MPLSKSMSSTSLRENQRVSSTSLRSNVDIVLVDTLVDHADAKLNQCCLDVAQDVSSACHMLTVYEQSTQVAHLELYMTSAL